jgi:uncharacterized protein with HEPN domain
MSHNEVYLRHILDEISFLQKTTRTLTLEKLKKDEVLSRACARSLEIIGEAVKNLPSDFKKQHPEIEWKKIAGLRDKIIHEYFGVNWDIVWDVIKNHLVGLKTDIKRII